MRLSRLTAIAAAISIAILTPGLAQAAPITPGGSTEVTVGSNDSLFSQNKQNEPGLAVNPVNPSILAAGANDNIDMEACNAGDDRTCPFTPGVGLSGVQFSTDAGRTWTQPTYTGYSARAAPSCLGAPDTSPGTPPAGDTGCVPDPAGPIGTLPRYAERGLVSNGDPELAFGPRPPRTGPSPGPTASACTTPTSPHRSRARHPSPEMRPSRSLAPTTSPAPSPARTRRGWPPVIVTRQNSALFSDKEQIWADNAESSPHFGNVYVCNVGFRGTAGSEPVLSPGPPMVEARGGRVSSLRRPTTARPVVDRAAPSAPTARAWSTSSGPAPTSARAATSSSRPAPPTAGPTSSVHGWWPASLGSGSSTRSRAGFTIDGIAGARTSNFPSVDIANGAPSGQDATDQVVLTWADNRAGLNQEKAFVSTSTDGGATTARRRWSATPGTGPTSPPSRSRLMARTPGWCTTPGWTPGAATPPPRRVLGVVKHAEVNPTTGTITGGPPCCVDRSATGAPRAPTASPPSSSATTTTRWPPGTTALPSGTTCETVPSVPR